MPGRKGIDAYLQHGDKVKVTTDASPYGFGGLLEINGTIDSSLADKISDQDRAALNLKSEPSSDDRKVFEAFAALVALHEWPPIWKSCRFVLSVETNSITKLSMVAKMQPHSARLGLIAREMAIDIGNPT